MNDSDLGIDSKELELDAFFEELLNNVGSNDIDLIPEVLTNDFDITTNDFDITTNDFDTTTNDVDFVAPISITDPCHIVLENVNGNLKVGTQVLSNVSESHIVDVCSFTHLITWTGRGSFILDVAIDHKNRSIPDSCDTVFTDLDPGKSITLTESRRNIRFNSETHGDRAFIIFDVVALPKKEEPTKPKLDHCVADDNCLTSIEDVRRFVLDRMIDDNEIDLELFFSDAEIITARRLAVATYNELPPYVDKIQLNSCNQDCLPAPIMFLNAIAYQLYLSKLQKLHKEDVEYQAGGMTVNIIKKRIAYITGTIKIFKDEFINLATARKTHINYSSAFGRVG